MLSLTDQNGGGVAIGEFDPDLTSYSGSVGSEVTHVTVTQSTTERSRFASRVLPPDSQPNVAGHQVALQHGANLFSVILMAPFHDDAVTSGTYDVIVTRAGSPSGTPTPTVSVYGLGDAKEGYTMPFILARTGDTSQSLTVPVNVSETGGDLVPQASEGSSDVVFPAGSASARIEVPTVADQDWEEHSTVTVAVVDGTGYELSSQSGSASSTVKDNDVPAVTAAFTVDSGQPQEGDVVTASVTVTTDGPKQPHGYVGNLAFSAEPGSAQQEDLHIPFDSNYRNFPEGHRVTGSRSYGGDGKSASFYVNQQAMQPVESDGVITHYQYQFSVPILIVDDERAEADETFDISVEWDSYSRGRTLIMDQGITSRTVTIQAHDDTPASPSPISYITVVIADSGTAGSTYTVSWHDTGYCGRYRNYEVYLAGKGIYEVYVNNILSTATSYITLGTTAGTNTQLTASEDNFPLSGQRLVQVYCGDRGRSVGEVPLPSATENSVERPVPGTYSSQPALTSLTVSPGTLGPAFNNYGFLYSVLDVPDSSSQITLNATARSGYTISWDPSQDADANTDGHQVDLAQGYDSIFVSVDHDLGINSFTYEVIVKGAGPIALQQQENSPATGTPTISGTVQMGETLTASTSGISDDNGLTNPSYTHQWLSNDGTSDSEIADATASTYTLVAGDVAETIKVRVSFTDDAGYEETSTSEATAAVAPADTDRPYGLAASATMASVTLTWQEPDNFYGPDYHILRHRPEEGEPDPLVYVEFTDTDATTFTDTDVEPGVLYVYQVRATIDFVSTLGEPSDPIEVRVPEKSRSDAPGESNTSATGTPTISGTAQVGETLAADTSGIADSDGLTKVTYSYQWIRNDAGTDTDIQGAAGTTYTLVDADEGKTIKVTVSFADDSGNEETLTSAATASVAARPNSPATGAPTISGTAQVAETLTASTSGIADSNGLTNASYSFQWIANDGTSDSDIAGATASTYAVPVGNVGKTIKVKVTFTDDAGNVESLTSAETAEVTATWKATLTVGGSENSQGTVFKGYSSFAGGLGGLTPRQFLIGEERHSVTVLLYSQRTLSLSISGNIGTGFVLHLGTDTFNLGDSSTRQGDTAYIYSWSDMDLDWSEADTVVVALVEAETEEASGNSPPTGVPSISGTVEVGDTLTASTSGIADTDGLTNASYSYEWLRNDGSTDMVIQDATGTSYTLIGADEGKTIKVKVSFTDDAGNEETLTSAATVSVAARSNSPATGAPTISGTAQVGETVTANTSGIADPDGLTNAAYSYQWIANDGSSGTDIQDATGASYTLVNADEGKTIKVEVSFTDDAGHEETLTSAATGEVAARPNSPATSAPTITGTAQVGETLTASTSGIADTDGLTKVSYSYQWVRNDGSSDTDIQDETDSTYSLVDADEGKTIKVKVTFTDDSGHEETLTSTATAAVAARPNSPATGSPTISGTVQVGETLTASTSGIADTDGLTNVSYSYQWIRNDGE